LGAVAYFAFVISSAWANAAHWKILRENTTLLEDEEIHATIAEIRRHVYIDDKY
jgi:hypothetical protein